MWRIILLFFGFLHSVRGSFLPAELLEDSPDKRAICLELIDDIFTWLEEKAVEVDYADEALKIISNEVGFQFSEDDPPNWYIDPSIIWIQVSTFRSFKPGYSTNIDSPA